MLTVIVGIASFILGALVFRNNSAAANKIISKVDPSATSSTDSAPKI